ncbi:MAG TPA: hypothetical protein VMU72_08325 [Gaiellaceae bacterium]|nr:hypothetical protein [Gaiellaceae bacterium]
MPRDGRKRAQSIKLRISLAAGLVVAAAVGAVVTLTSASISAAGSKAGMSDVPGMTRVISVPAPWCSAKDTALPTYCTEIAGSAGLEEGWVSTPALEAFGLPGQGVPSIPPAFAQSHPGPLEAFIEVVPLASADAANQLLESPDYTGASDPNFTQQPGDAINGGLALFADAPGLDGLDEYRFVWVGGTSVVEVNVLGSNLTAAEAQGIARLAGPA